jgi:hypothetical protein
MLVRALRAHGNQFGLSFCKAPGDVYEHPHPRADIDFGYVDPAPDGDLPSPTMATSVAAAAAEEASAVLGAARKRYRAVFRKNAGPRWTVPEIEGRIAERTGGSPA